MAIKQHADKILDNMDDQDTWARICEQHADLYKTVMPMALTSYSLFWEFKDLPKYTLSIFVPPKLNSS